MSAGQGLNAGLQGLNARLMLRIAGLRLVNILGQADATSAGHLGRNVPQAEIIQLDCNDNTIAFFVRAATTIRGWEKCDLRRSDWP
jgi:hypothetical protein